MSAQLIIETVAAVAGCLAVWLVPLGLLWAQQRSDHQELSGKIDNKVESLRAEMTQRIDGLAAQQRQDHQHLVSLILQTRGIKQEESA